MLYFEHPAPPRLAPWVECVWTLDGRFEGMQRVLPDGCVEIVLHRGEPMRQAGERQPRRLVAGQMDRSLLLEAGGRAEVTGIRFHPEGARAFFAVPMHELTNRFVDLDAVIPAAAVRRLDEARLVESVWCAIAEQLRGAPEPDRRVAAAVRLTGRVEDIAARMNTSPRQLDRLFRDHVGLPPNVFARIQRFQQVLTAWDRGDWPRVADLAAECGFYDQAHLCREFQRFCGRNPSAFFEQPEVMARLFLRGRRMSDSYKHRR